MKFQSVARAAVLAVFASGGVASAATFGIAVNPNDGSPIGFASTAPGDSARTELSTIANSTIPGLGAAASDAIRYFNPVDPNTVDCTFGIGTCGVQADTGGGGAPGVMSMFIDFTNVDGGNSFLNIFFEDLDIIGANDPAGFFEVVTIFDTDDNEIFSVSDVSATGVSGTAATQQLATIPLGILNPGQDLRLRFDFSSSFDGSGTNTDEYLIPVITAVPVPLPASFWFMALAVGGLVTLRRARATEEA